jgi:2-octaprenyl-6-methoxyphenol hydroxylase
MNAPAPAVGAPAAALPSANPAANPAAQRAGDAAAPLIIIGGGPIGLVCALLLARSGLASTLVDARPVEALQRDRRLLALSRGTLDILEPLLGTQFAPLGEIHRILVSSSGRPGAAQLGSRDFGGMAVGATIWYADLVDALARAARAQPLIQVQRPRRALAVRQRVHTVDVELDNATVLRGPLAIDAEGTPPQGRDAPQTALLAELDLACAPGDAIERFTGEGPLALLPLPPAQRAAALDGGAAAQGKSTRMSMVWCLPTALAQSRLGLPEAELCALIHEALGAHRGAPTGLGPRSTFPLLTHRRERVCEHRLVHLGNAAQSLHPVAGQGFNLGIRDCLCLVQCLEQAPLGAAGPAGTAPGSDPLRALHLYAARRRLDRTLFPALTNALPRVFASSLPPVVLARSAALFGLDLLPALRRPFTRLLMYGASR